MKSGKTKNGKSRDRKSKDGKVKSRKTRNKRSIGNRKWGGTRAKIRSGRREQGLINCPLTSFIFVFHAF